DPGLNVADVPGGKPAALRLTLPLNPLSTFTDTVKVAPCPELMPMETGTAAMPKSGGGTTALLSRFTIEVPYAPCRSANSLIPHTLVPLGSGDIPPKSPQRLPR